MGAGRPVGHAAAGFAGWMSFHSAVGRGSAADSTEGSTGGGVPSVAVGAAVIRIVGLPLGAVAGLSVTRVPGQSAKRSVPARAASARHWVRFSGRQLCRAQLMLRPKSSTALASGRWVRGLCSCSTAMAVMVNVTERSRRSAGASQRERLGF